jgi:predicted HNH restriction endonuclease|nr:MAG TPA: co-chaperone HscB [Caudoviricetes sp.]
MPENDVVCLCWNCGKEIHKDENLNYINEEIWCDECANTKQ